MVHTALLVRLEAKAGKEAEVESFLRAGLPVVKRSRRRLPGLRFGSGRRPSVFSMSFPTRLDDKRIFPAGLPLR